MKRWFSESRARWRVACNPVARVETRFFAAAEVVCFWLSVVPLLWLPLQLVAMRGGWLGDLPVWWSRGVLPVLLAAAIGYLTNYIAIAMLFKPYVPGRWHFFSLITLGYWRQGLLPRNKQRIAAEVGSEVAGQLLRPEEISDELCRLAGELLHDPRVLPAVRTAMQQLLQDNCPAITAFLLPRVEAALKRALNEMLTVARVRAFCQETLLPQLLHVENRQQMADWLLATARANAPELARQLRSGCEDYLTSALQDKLPAVVQMVVEPRSLARGLCERFDWLAIRRQLEERLSTAEIRELLTGEIERGATRLQDWLVSPAGAKRLERLIADNREYAGVLLGEYLRDNLPGLVGDALGASELSGWIESSLQEKVRPFLETLIRTHGKDRVIAALNIEERIRTAVDRQDIREFHAMINRLAAEHLGAIQVLGYLLGGAIGLLQLVAG